MSVDSLHVGLRYSHVVLGFVGLLLFWVPVFAKKGGRVHILSGRMFVWCATYVGVTALIGSLWALASPVSYAGNSLANAGPEVVAKVSAQFRFFYSILLFLSLAILSGVTFGVRVIRTRREHHKLKSPLLVGLEVALGITSLWLAAYGGWNLFLAFSGRHSLPIGETSKFWIPAALGVFGVIGVIDDLKYILRPRPTPMAWWYTHMENMLGVGIGFHTAFLVFGASRLFDIQIPGAWKLVPWILPSAIGLPAIGLWKRYYQRKFGELGGPPQGVVKLPAKTFQPSSTGNQVSADQ